MNEHNCVAAIKFLKNWLEPFIAQIDLVDIRKKHYPVMLKNIECVSHF